MVKRVLCMAAVAALVCGLGFAAVAQEGRGPRLSPEKAEAAWAIQAKGVAKDLGITGEAADKLVEAYKTSRKSYNDAVQALASEQGGDRGARFQRMAEIAKTEKENLGKALAAFLPEEQAQKALATLGTFSRQWDMLVDTFASYGLEGEKQDKGLALIAQYAVDSSAARDKAMAERNFESMRSSMQELKAKLDTALADVLSEEQLASWKESTTFRGGEGRGGPGAPGGPAAGSAGQGAPGGAGEPAAPGGRGPRQGGRAADRETE